MYRSFKLGKTLYVNNSRVLAMTTLAYTCLEFEALANIVGL